MSHYSNTLENNFFHPTIYIIIVLEKIIIRKTIYAFQYSKLLSKMFIPRILSLYKIRNQNKNIMVRKFENIHSLGIIDFLTMYSTNPHIISKISKNKIKIGNN